MRGVSDCCLQHCTTALILYFIWLSGRHFMFRTCLLLVIILVAGFVVGFSADNKPQARGTTTLTSANVDEARRQATLLHETYVATLLVVHREYFDEDERQKLPARAFEDVFRNMDERTKGHTRWISVNAPAMNLDHEPKPGFEKQAAESLTNGDEYFERVEDGYYHRAAGIQFAASCSKCHLSGLGHRRAGRMAGLVISLPIQTP